MGLRKEKVLYWICKILTWNRHLWKHYPGEKRYVRCRLCGRLPKAQWIQLQKMKGQKNEKR